MSADMLSFMVALHAKAAIFTLLVLGVAHAARRASSRNRYLVLRMTLAVVAVVPLLKLAMPDIAIPLDLWHRQSAEGIPDVLRANGADGGPAATTALPYSTAAVLLAGYLCISGLLLLRMVVGFLRTRSDIGRYRLIDQPRLLSLLAEVRQQLGVKNPVALVMDPGGAGPYVWGIRRQIIAVPMGFLAAPPHIQRTVLTHELIHIVRRDTVTCLAARVLCCLYWINPVIWLLNARLLLEMEQSCDDEAVSSGIQAPDYASHLLKAIRQFDATRRPGSAVAMARASSINHRIRSLLNSRRHRGIMSNSRSVGIFSALLLAGTALGALSATNAATLPSSQEALIAGVNRLVPEGCQTIQVSFLATGAVDITGRCASASRVAAFMRGLDRAGGKPELEQLETNVGENRNSFKLRLASPQTFAPG